MEQSQWSVIVDAIKRVCRSAGRLPRARYSDQLILKLHFWAVNHDRPAAWSLSRENRSGFFRPRRLPGVSQLGRRLRSRRLVERLAAVNELLRGPVTTGEREVLCVDGRALCVSPVSGDRDARRGYVAHGKGRGYKLHAVVDGNRKVVDFRVLPLNCHELAPAREMLAGLGTLKPGTVVLADGNYDAHKFHKDIDRLGGWLVTWPRGRARHPVTLRQMGPARRRMLQRWEDDPAEMRRLYSRRGLIERVFGTMTCTPGLLGPLPSFVRGLERVRRWVTTKISLYHARLEAKRR